MACVAEGPDKEEITTGPDAVLKLSVSGIVQGVGFRPFVFRLAYAHNIAGSVANTKSGVEIIAAGTAASLCSFTHDLAKRHPSAAQIDAITREELPPHSVSGSGFSIKTSAQTGTRTTLVPPDMDICQECLQELFDPANRRFLYPFINCTNCGPRYTLITDLPYDRPATSMHTFQLCPSCREEYDSPLDRRFHAQPNACAECGPRLSLVDGSGNRLPGNPLHETQQLLAKGKIIAIKGIGGFHLAVDARNPSAVAALRNRKGRPDKPLAVMAATTDAILTFAELSHQERLLLESRVKPIVLLTKKERFPLAANLSQQNSTIGVMLPYSPLHHLLFYGASFSALVMTSGNLSEEPIAIDNNEAMARLSTIADLFLLHDRPILTSNDDSVVMASAETPIWLRRSRALAPAPLSLHYDAGATLAVGGALKNTICLTRNKHYFFSQHIGDLKHLESVDHFTSVIDHLQHLLQISPDLVVHDLHPDYPSTLYAQKRGLPSIAVQHHHAHAVACMVENSLTEQTIAVVLDGTGYGPDQTIWGGEILVADYAHFERAAHFSKIPLPGGEQAIQNPWRTALGYLSTLPEANHLQSNLGIMQRHQDAAPIIAQMIERRINTPLTSSCGRLFDCVAALLDLRDSITFEGQAAMELESLALSLPANAYPFEIKSLPQQPLEISFNRTVLTILEELRTGTDKREISSRFHQTIAQAITEACSQIRDQRNIYTVALSGGVFQNRILLHLLQNNLREHGFSVFFHKELPTSDGGIALGQAVAGRAMYKKIGKRIKDKGKSTG